MRKPRILITGGSGLLALNWFVSMRNRYDVVLAFHERTPLISRGIKCKVDLDSPNDLLDAIDRYAPKFIIHTAGLTNVEECEKFPDIAQYVNVNLAVNVAKACRARSVPFVYISTDHLFSGNSERTTEETPVRPLNVYGKSKADAELLVIEAYPEALIVRTNFYGWGTSYRKSFTDFIIESLRNECSILLFDDVYYTPIIIERLAEIVHELLLRRAMGIYNVVGSQRISKYEFGHLVAKCFGLNTALIERGLISNVTGLVRRPLDMSLSNHKLVRLLGRDPGSINEHIEVLKLQEKCGLAHELGKL